MNNEVINKLAWMSFCEGSKSDHFSFLFLTEIRQYSPNAHDTACELIATFIINGHTPDD